MNISKNINPIFLIILFIHNGLLFNHCYQNCIALSIKIYPHVCYIHLHNSHRHNLILIQNNPHNAHNNKINTTNNHSHNEHKCASPHCTERERKREIPIIKHAKTNGMV